MKLAFEFNGTYYHSVERDPQNYEYHLNKTKECKSLGIKLVHIWEDEWIYENENASSSFLVSLVEMLVLTFLILERRVALK